MNGGGEPASWRMLSWTTNNGTSSPGGFGSVQDLGETRTNRIMLRFRPIAPKPANPDPSLSTVANSYKPRKKRKYVRVRKSKKKDTSSSSSSPDPKSSRHVVTLQLLPENSHPHKEEEAAAVDRNFLSSFPPRKCNQLDLTVAASAAEGNNNNNSYYSYNGTDLMSWRRENKVVEESWVTVESAAEISSSSSAFGYCMDLEEVKIRLDGDTCPGFVSDGCNRVVWVNGAYMRMVGTAAVRVRVVMKDDEVAASFPRENGGGAYTCWVRVRGATWRKEMVPCDVWRVENGGLAWRLDVEAALTLGPGSETGRVGGITQGTLIAP